MTHRLTILLLVVCLCGSATNLSAQDKGFQRSVDQRKRSIRKYLGFRWFNLKRLETFKPYHYFGGGINALNYFGDLAPVNKAASTDLSFTRPGVGAFYGYKFHQSFAMRFNYNFGILRGDDYSADPQASQSSHSRYQRNLSFRNMLHETSVNLAFSILPERTGMRDRPLVNAHVIVGVGLFRHNPQGKVPDGDYQMAPDAPLPIGLIPGKWIDLQPLDTEGSNLTLDDDGNPVVPKNAGGAYSRLQLAIPLAIGGVTHITKNLSAGIEFSLRITFTDYLDDVSTSYVDLDSFEDPVARLFSDRSVEPMAVVQGQARTPESVTAQIGRDGQQYRINGVVGSGVTGSIRGNPDVNDHYFLTQIKVFYSLRAR